MALRTFTNKDLNKPMTGSKSKTYTNADLDIEDDFQPDDFMADSSTESEDDFQPDESATMAAPTAVSEDEPDTWREGFVNSIMKEGDFKEGFDSLKGFAKGTFLDLPKNIMSGLRMGGNALALSAGPVGEMITGKSTLDRIGEIPGNIYNVGKGMLDMAEGASDVWNQRKPPPSSEEFGRLMGNVTGQPLATYGMAKGAPGAIRTAGKALEPTGKFIRENRPFTSFIPPMAEPRMFTGMQRGGGRALEYIGSKMKDFGKAAPSKSPVLQGEVVDDFNPNFTEGQVIPNNRLELPPSRTSYYQGAGAADDVPLAQQVLDEGAPEVQLSQNPRLNRVPDTPITEPTISPSAIQAMDEVHAAKPAVRLNPDGTYTRFDTGEIVDSRGRPMAAPIPDAFETQAKYRTDIPETMPIGDLIRIQDQPGRITQIQAKERPRIERLKQDIQEKGLQEPIILRRNPHSGNLLIEDGHHRVAAAKELGMKEIPVKMGEKGSRSPEIKEVTIKNAPPNQRAKLFRGKHDTVDILFENANDRRIFGAGQNIFSQNKTVNPNLVQTSRMVTEGIAQQYGLPIQTARKLVTDYNRRLRELSKDMPKYGEDLNFKAPSFETFMDSALRGKQPTHPLNIGGEKGSLSMFGKNKSIIKDSPEWPNTIKEDSPISMNLNYNPKLTAHERGNWPYSQDISSVDSKTFKLKIGNKWIEGTKDGKGVTAMADELYRRYKLKLISREQYDNHWNDILKISDEINKK